MTADAWPLQGLGHKLFQDQGGAQYRDAVPFLGVGSKNTRVGVRAACHHQTFPVQACLQSHQFRNPAGAGAAGDDLGQRSGPRLLADAAAPAVFDQIPAQSEIVAFLTPAPVPQQPAHQPVRLMTQSKSRVAPWEPGQLHQLQGPGQAAAGRGGWTVYG